MSRYNDCIVTGAETRQDEGLATGECVMIQILYRDSKRFGWLKDHVAIQQIVL